MVLPGKVIKVRITPENLSMFRINEWRDKRPDYIKDRQWLEKEMIKYENGEKNEKTENYPGRYDLTVLTYTQHEEPYLINDGCHRIMAMRTTLFPENLISGFTFWLIPSNVAGTKTKEEAFKLNELVNKELKKAGLPLWVKKFEFTNIDGRLVAWKNINIINSGDLNQPLHFGVDWFLNEGIFFADGKEPSELPKYRDLIKKW